MTCKMSCQGKDILIQCVVILAILTGCAVVAKTPSSPHIIFIVADDLGWNDVGWHNRDIKTPNLDRLAKLGVILNSSYVQPTCTPSRASFLTGVYPFRMGLQSGVIRPQETGHLPLRFQTLPEKLQEHGYSTHLVGKWHLGFCNWNYTPTYRGFDSFMGFYNGAEDYYLHTREKGYDFRYNESVFYPPKKQYSTKTFADRSVNIIREANKGEKPLYLFLSFQSVHTPLQSPRKYQRLYRHIKNKQRRMYSGGKLDIQFGLRLHGGCVATTGRVYSSRAPIVTFEFFETMVTAMDDAIGNVIAALRKYKMLQNSVIVFTTDNGGAAHVAGNNLPLRGSKTTLWEGGTRAVSFVFSKRYLRKKGYIHDGIFHAVDWYPTLLAAAGIRTKGMDIDGVNQWPMVRNRKPSRRKDFVYNIDRYSSAIRMGNYKLIVGSPGVYNDWYKIPSSSFICRKFKEYEDEIDDIFIYQSLNNVVRVVRSYFKWITNKVSGYKWLQNPNRLRHFERCREHEKQQKKKYRFPKYHLYNLRDDPTERHNIAGKRIRIFKRLKKRLDSYAERRVKLQSKVLLKAGHPHHFNGIWSPGWC